MLSALFDHALDVDPSADLEPALKLAPARWCVYCFADADDRPVQLLCVRNLRASLKTRLIPDEAAPPSKRVDYRALVRRIYWTRVDSVFEADVAYLALARTIFADRYQAMIGFRPAWFVHVNPETTYPRWIKTTDPSITTGVVLGPLEDKGAAAKLVEFVEDAFDLCRYDHILVQSPNGKACAYKDMGKCPAPCDGSVALDSYRKQVELSVATLVDPAAAVREHTKRMAAAASELKFESAAKIKAYVDALSTLGKGQTRFLKRLREFQYICLQRGPRDQTAKLFLLTPTGIDPVAAFIAEPGLSSDVLRQVFARAEKAAAQPLDEASAERISLATHHLFSPKQSTGVFLSLDALDDRSLAKAFRDVQKQKVVETSEVEGVTKEIGAF